MHTPLPNMKSKTIAFIKELLTFAAISLIIVIPVRIFIAQPFIVSGESMYPTFETGQYLIVDQLSYRFNDPQRGDVVIFNYPKNPSKFFIKRVIGLPSETVVVDGTSVYITKTDGEEILLKEPYIAMQKESDIKTTLEDDEYFVMGDNRLASLDSRVWGPLEEKFIVGKAYIRLLPFDKMTFFPGNKE